MLGYYKMSIIGTAHQAKENGICQDASDVTVLDNGWIVAAIADGLGSAKKSDIGSSEAVRTVLSFVDDNCPDVWHEESLISLLRLAYHKAFKEIKKISENDKDNINDYDTTLTTAIYNGSNVIYGHVGDGGIIALSSYGDYSVLTEAQKGEAFNETCPLRSGPSNWFFGSSKEDVCSFVMMTDGIFDIACPWLLARTEQPIYINYVRSFMDTNILKVTNQEDFESAQNEIRDFLCGPYSKQITDDKTIVGVINTDIIPDTKDEDFYKEPDWKRLAQEHHDLLYKKDCEEKIDEKIEQDENNNLCEETEFKTTELEIYKDKVDDSNSGDLKDCPENKKISKKRFWNRLFSK